MRDVSGSFSRIYGAYRHREQSFSGRNFLRLARGGRGGFASLIVLIFLSLTALFGGGILYFTQNSLAVARFCEEELRLRLLAEGAIEMEAEKILRESADMSAPVGAEEFLGEYREEAMRCKVYRKQRERGIELIAVSQGEDGSGNKNYKKLHAFLEKKEGEARYVWKSYLPERL